MKERANEPGGQRIARKIFMIYDAKAGWISAVKDSMLKIIGSGCSLCFVTHGLAGKRQETRDLEGALGESAAIEYRHIGELSDLESRLGVSIETPSVLVELENDDIVVLMDGDAIELLRARLTAGGSMDDTYLDRQEASLRGALQYFLAAKGIASPLDDLPGSTM